MGEGSIGWRCGAVLPLPFGERDGVRGFRALLFCRTDYRFENAVDVLQHVMIPEAEDQIPHRFQRPGPCHVAFAFVVLPTVHFNNEMSVLTTEVDDELTERCLPSKFQSLEPPVAHAKP
jgi:hypothetical protein